MEIDIYLISSYQPFNNHFMKWSNQLGKQPVLCMEFKRKYGMLAYTWLWPMQSLQVQYSFVEPSLEGNELWPSTNVLIYWVFFINMVIEGPRSWCYSNNYNVAKLELYILEAGLAHALGSKKLKLAWAHLKPLLDWSGLIGLSGLKPMPSPSLLPTWTSDFQDHEVIKPQPCPLFIVSFATCYFPTHNPVSHSMLAIMCTSPCCIPSHTPEFPI